MAVCTFKDQEIKVEPIRELEAIAHIKRNLSDHPRNSALFIMGINTNLRASDLLQITIGEVRGVAIGESFYIGKEQKTGKGRTLTMNKSVFEGVRNLLELFSPSAPDSELLFQSRKSGKSGKKIAVSTLSTMVKGWCRDAKIKGNYGSHTLRKTFGYMHRTVNKTDIPTLMTLFNHSSQKQTLDYLCIQPDEIKQAYMFEL